MDNTVLLHSSLAITGSALCYYIIYIQMKCHFKLITYVNVSFTEKFLHG